MHITPPGKRTFSPQKSILVAFVLALAVFGVARAALGSYDKYVAQRGKSDKVAGDLAISQAREAELRKDAEWLKTTRAQEGVVRERYMVTKPGEKMIVVSPNEDDGDKVITTPLNGAP